MNSLFQMLMFVVATASAKNVAKPMDSKVPVAIAEVATKVFKPEQIYKPILPHNLKLERKIK